jgi:hypothetical protein
MHSWVSVVGRQIARGRKESVHHGQSSVHHHATAEMSLADQHEIDYRFASQYLCALLLEPFSQPISPAAQSEGVVRCSTPDAGAQATTTSTGATGHCPHASQDERAVVRLQPLDTWKLAFWPCPTPPGRDARCADASMAAPP